MSEPGWTERSDEHRPSRRERSEVGGTSAPPRPQRYERSGGDNLPVKGELTMAQVEERIVRADDELAELTSVHMDLAEAAAFAEATWKRHRDTVIVRTVAGEGRTAADYREALAREEIDPITGLPGHELYTNYKVTGSRADSSARAMRAIESRISAFQTIASNLRKLTGP